MTNNPIIIANWKMKLSLAETLALAKTLKMKADKKAEVVVCPTFPALAETAKVLKGGRIKLGAQDCFWENSGSYTGEVSAPQLKEIGCQFVIIGHSERRKYLNETDEMIHAKTKAALEAGLTPIICVGETFEQRQEGAKDYVIIHQTTKALEGIEIKSHQQVIVAYEPVWVIGSGQAVSPNAAQEVHDVIRQVLLDLFNLEVVSNNFRIVYGGSVDQTNVKDFLSLENTSGVLVGMASLRPSDFLPLIKNA
ncbi:MAG: triose-phosphate isomerase [Candidatus Buchananbacteria bacterium]